MNEESLKHSAERFTISQIDAATDVLAAIKELEKHSSLRKNNPYHKPIIETDVYQLRRGLCLPCAAASAINQIFNRPVITGRKISYDSQQLSIGDMYRLLIPHHGKYQSEKLPKGWLVVNQEGDMYHHSIIAFAKMLRIFGYSITGIHDLSDLRSFVSQNSGVVISLNNRFVIEQTLKNNPDYVEIRNGQTFIKVQSEKGYEYKPFRDGRHVVTILQISEENIRIADSFNLPQNYNPYGIIMEIPITVANQYLSYHDNSPTRGIIFSKKQLEIPFPQNNIIIPKEVEDALSLLILTSK